MEHIRLTIPRIVLPLLAVLVLLAPGAAPALAQTDERCFAETGFCISGTIRAYWEQNGGLAVFGLPLGPQQATVGEDGVTRQAQWFERHRLEIHPENDPPYNVLLGRLGVDALAAQGRDWQAFPPFDDNQADAERCRFFQETNRQVCDEFLTAFRTFGLNFPNTPGITFEESLALFGFPISDPMTETIDGKELTVQWFERARFELHPENDPPFNVLFGRLGAELSGDAAEPAPGGDDATGVAALRENPWTLVSYGPADAPVPAAGSDRGPATLRFEEERVSGFSGCNGFGGGYQATDSTITFGNLISTLVACEDPIDSQERAIFGALQGERPYSIVGGELRISYDEGRSALVYRAQGIVSGTVTYLQRIALPPQAIIEVKLVDVSRADAPAIVIDSVTFEAGGRQVPFSFELTYDPAQIDDRFTYAVQARITIDGELRFISTRSYQVITRGNPNTVEIIVEPVR
jgi:uncharacterized lipoprotein YbaY/heat shock protein HslJ